MQEVGARPALLAAALAVAATPALAIDLGEAQVRSALGEVLDARIPLTVPAGRSVEAACFAVVRDTEPGIPVLGEARLTIDRSGAQPVLRVRSRAPVADPAVLLRLRVGCPGEPEALRQFSVLLDPRSGAGPVVDVPTIAATLDARGGDTLQSVARRVFPRNRPARSQYLAALRASNPTLAAAGDDAAIAEGAAIALPDLRTYPRIAAREPAKARVAQRTQTAPAPSAKAATALPAPRPQRATKLAEKGEAVKPAPAPAPRPAQAPAPAARPATPPRVANGPGFVLKLSAPEVDLAPSRRIDDRFRAQLRERQLVLDSDDQIAALLAMRNSLKQLEARVSELQLKLAAMPPALAARPEASAPSAATKPTPAPAPSVAAKPAPQPAPPPTRAIVVPAPISAPPSTPAPTPALAPQPAIAAAPPPPPRLAEPTPPKPAAPSPPPVTTSTAAATTSAAPKPATPPGVPAESSAAKAVSQKPVARPPEPESEGLPAWLWGLVALLAAAAALIALRLRLRRRRAEAEEESYEMLEPELGTAEEATTAKAPSVLDEEPILAAAPDERRVVSSDAELATRIPGNQGELRRRYIEERFPEVVNRTVVLEDPASVVKAARLFYEDGALPRAVELLQFAVETNPREIRTWLALFEIYRLERLTGGFAELAQRFRQHHGETEWWRKVQFFGREIDPSNPLYKDETLSSLETIGPREARKLAAGGAAALAANFDPITENWLNAPMDFENEVLANELRRTLMAQATLGEQDLIPNAMPALRNVEMFTVA